MEPVACQVTVIERTGGEIRRYTLYCFSWSDERALSILPKPRHIYRQEEDRPSGIHANADDSVTLYYDMGLSQNRCRPSEWRNPRRSTVLPSVRPPIGVKNLAATLSQIRGFVCQGERCPYPKAACRQARGFNTINIKTDTRSGSDARCHI